MPSLIVLALGIVHVVARATAGETWWPQYPDDSSRFKRFDSPEPLDENMVKLRRYAPARGQRCNTSVSNAIAAYQPIRHSNCPNTRKMMSALLQSTPPKKPGVLVFVGCNKGYDFIGTLRDWTRNGSFSIPKLLHAHRKHGLRGRDFGACGSGQTPDSMISNSSFGIRETTGWCIEPMVANIDLLNKSFGLLGYRSDPRVHMVHAAISSNTGKALFPRGKSGTEHFGIAQSDQGGGDALMDVVDVMTLDEVIPMDVTTIDFLSIDTEGNDMRVIFGSTQLLATHNVRYLEFEYHSAGHWAQSDLSDLTDLLDQFGFDCYIPGNGGELWRLTGCWHDSYYRRTWSNVACVSRTEVELHSMMEETARGYV